MSNVKSGINRNNLVLILGYILLFVLGTKVLPHHFPDVDRFFSDWMDEGIELTMIMKFGMLNFAPTQVIHPPLYHYLTFVPVCAFFIIGKLIGLFHDKIDFVRFYFNNTQYFFLIGRIASYIFFWLSAIMIFKICRLFYSRTIAHISTFAYLLIPRFVADYSVMRPETLLFLNAAIFFYFYLKYCLNKGNKYILFAAFFWGVSTASKYNACFLGVIFVPTLLIFFKQKRAGLSNYKDLLFTSSKICVLAFLGFFICDPFFILKIGTYLHNLAMYSMEARYYWGDRGAVFGWTHIKELNSLLYLNVFGFFIFLLGIWSLCKKYRYLVFCALFTILVYELYFGIFQKSFSPLRYLNPVMPMAALFFAAGIDFVVMNKKKFALVFAAFAMVLLYNYFEFWNAYSLRPTYMQQGRAFIEKNIPEFTVICLVSRSRIPQLSMTKESYYRLIDNPPTMDAIKGHELTYVEMDSRKKYEDIYKNLKVESMAKTPQYNLFLWDRKIMSKDKAVEFFKNNGIQYAISDQPWIIGSEKIEDTKIASLIKVFKPENRRAWAGTEPYPFDLYIYKINR